jgi:hypothetical protein
MIVVAVVLFFLARPQGVTINVETTPSVLPIARPATAELGPPPTFTPQPGLPVRTPTPLPTPTPVPVVSPVPMVATPVAVMATPVPVVATPLPSPTPPPEPTPAPTPTPLPPPPSPTPSPSPTPFAGQVAGPGGLGNTRSDLDAAYGGPVGETPDKLVAYRKSPFEYHVSFSPGQERAGGIVELPQPNTPPLSLETAMTEARKLFPKDSQSRAAQPEGNTQFVVERFTSPTLAKALGDEVFQANKGQPGDFLVVYVRDTQQSGRINRTVLGPGNDPNQLLSFR